MVWAMALSDLDARVLRFAATAPRGLGEREAAIRSQLGMSPTRYYQRLNLLLDDADALAESPLLVRRLTRLRDSRLGNG